MTPEELVRKYRHVGSEYDNHPLDELDLTDWSSLSHAHGEASDVPALLRALVTESEKDREFAFQLLFETIWHQDTVYEASAYTVPFLYKLLTSSQTPEKASIAHLLAKLADGRSYLDVHAFHDEESKAIWREILAKRDRSLKREVIKEIFWVKTTREAVGKNLPQLYPYLTHESAPVREDIARALGFYREFSNETLPLLESSLETEDDMYAKKAMEEAIAMLKD